MINMKSPRTIQIYLLVMISTIIQTLHWDEIFDVTAGLRPVYLVGPVKLNKDRPAGPVDILGPLGPATFVSSVSFNID